MVDEDEKGGRMSVAGQGRMISVSVGERGGGGVDSESMAVRRSGLSEASVKP